MLRVVSTSYVSISAACWVYFLHVGLCYTSGLLHTFPLVLHVGSSPCVSGRATIWVYFIRFRSCYIVGTTSYVFGLATCWVYFIRSHSHTTYCFYFSFTSCRLHHATYSVSTGILDLLILIMLVNSANFEASHYAIFSVSVTSARGFVCEYFVTKIRLHGEELLAPRPTPKVEEHPLSAVLDCLFNIFAATLPIGGRSSIRNLRTRRRRL
jgi:hypothetical protein